MVQTTTKFRFPFDDKKMLFEETYPEELHAVFPREEFVATLRKLNYDLNQTIQGTSQDLKKWTTGTAIAICFLLGIFAVPVVWRKASKNQKEMEIFWTKVREYLTELNRRDLIRRGIEWKVVEDQSKIKGHDTVNKVYCMRIDLLWRTGMVKSKKALEREARLRGAHGEESTSITAGPSVSSEAAFLATPSGFEPPSAATAESAEEAPVLGVPITEEEGVQPPEEAPPQSPIEEVTGPIGEGEEELPETEEGPPVVLPEEPVAEPATEAPEGALAETPAEPTAEATAEAEPTGPAQPETTLFDLTDEEKEEEGN